MTDIPEELVVRVQCIIMEVVDGRAMSKNTAKAAIRAVLDWQAKEWVEIPRLDRQHPSPARVTPQGK